MKPNILFLVIDSFRADKCFGNNKTSKTPIIDSLIKRGIYFSQTFGSAPSSIPASATILTALYPFKSLLSDKNNHRLDPRVRTFISIIKDHGYSTYATLPDLFSLVGLTRDFQNVTALPFADMILSKGLGQKILNNLELNNMKEPWIHYLHLMDLHELNQLPVEFDTDGYGNNKYERMVSALDCWLGKILQKIDFDNTLVVLTADHGSDADEYTSDIENLRKNDKELEQNPIFKFLVRIVANFPSFLEPLRTRVRETYQSKVEKRTLKKIQALSITQYKKRILLNAVNLVYQLYDEKFHVPLIFVGYGISPGPQVTQQVRSIDIFPTILEILGFSEGDYKVHGRSLLPLIQGKNLSEVPVYMESVGNRTRVFTTNEIGIRTSRYKYFRSRKDSTTSVHLYDLKNDPLEEINIVDSKPEIVVQMENILREITKDLSDKPDYKTIEGEITEEQIKKINEELSKLGYRNVGKLHK